MQVEVKFTVEEKPDEFGHYHIHDELTRDGKLVYRGFSGLESDKGIADLWAMRLQQAYDLGKGHGREEAQEVAAARIHGWTAEEILRRES